MLLWLQCGEARVAESHSTPILSTQGIHDFMHAYCTHRTVRHRSVPTHIDTITHTPMLKHKRANGRRHTCMQACTQTHLHGDQSPWKPGDAHLVNTTKCMKGKEPLSCPHVSLMFIANNNFLISTSI